MVTQLMIYHGSYNLNIFLCQLMRDVPPRKHCHLHRHPWSCRGTVVTMIVVTMMTTQSQLIGYRRHSHNMFPLSQQSDKQHHSFTQTFYMNF